MAFTIPQRKICCTKMICVHNIKSSTIGCGASIIALIWPTTLSNLTTKNKVYNDLTIDDDSHFFETTINSNHDATELIDMHTKAT